jgi:hypothetical protein
MTEGPAKVVLLSQAFVNRLFAAGQDFRISA